MRKIGVKYILGISMFLLLSCSENDTIKKKMVGKWIWVNTEILEYPPKQFGKGIIEFTENGSLVVKNDTTMLEFVGNGKLRLINTLTDPVDVDTEPEDFLDNRGYFSDNVTEERLQGVVPQLPGRITNLTKGIDEGVPNRRHQGSRRSRWNS